jgi:LmbE family N-acetylglucosaminyl deacetylase
MSLMPFIYLSPHLDDVTFSLGGLVWQRAQAGEQAEVWTICAGDPPDESFSPFAQAFHQRWGIGPEAVAHRRAEDRAACALLGAEPRYFSLLDCIYRRHPQTGEPLYTSNQQVFGPLDPAEAPLIDQLTEELAQKLPPDAQLICPLTVGKHIDHRLTRAAAERLDLPLWYYADYPYAAQLDAIPQELIPPGATLHVYPLSDEALALWGDAIATYASQLSTFWPDPEALRDSLTRFYQRHGGVLLCETSS